MAAPKRVPVDVRFSRLVPPQAAAWVPWPRTIRFKPGTPLYVGLMAHELMHVLQAEKYGKAWPAVYLAQWLKTGIMIGSFARAYHEMPFEKEARRAEQDLDMRVWARDIIDVLKLVDG